MAKIKLKVKDSPYETRIDTDVMDVEITEAFLGVRFVTADGKTLSVSIRDGGFELQASYGTQIALDFEKRHSKIDTCSIRAQHGIHSFIKAGDVLICAGNERN